MLPSCSVGAIIVAAGNSQRMLGMDKLWIDLGGQPLLARTIAAVVTVPGLTRVVVVAGSDTLQRSLALADQEPWARVHRWVPGGSTRQDSVYLGLQALDPCTFVLIHDGARPLVSTDVLARGIEAAVLHGSAVAAVPVTDTVKVVDDSGRVTATPERATLRAAQTPQIFADALIREAYDRVGAARSGCTDDAGILELAGLPVYTYAGERTNMKVSTPDDVAIVRALWAARTEGTQG